MNAATHMAMTTPPMGELNVSNALLDDRKALDAAWERDGYWYFRGVLDLEAVAQLREVYLNVLRKLGVIGQDSAEAVYNGGSMEGYPLRMEPLVEMRPWRSFVRHPAIHAFFRRVLADEPFWIPTVEYRATPPNGDRTRNRLDYPHQDGFYNQGIPFRICWIPLASVDATIGGLAITEGLHKGPCLHDAAQPPLYPIPPAAIPEHAWKRATYLPGDLLMFDINSPHSGLANYSDRYFRLSMDIRVMPASGKAPMIGTVTAVEPGAIEVQSEDGRRGRFLLNEATFCRGIDGKKVALADIPTRLHPGDEVIVANQNGYAEVIRPPH